MALERMCDIVKLSGELNIKQMDLVALFVMVIAAVFVTFSFWIIALRKTIFKLRRDVMCLETEMRETQNELMALLIKDDARKELYEFLKKEYENEQSRIDSGNI